MAALAFTSLLNLSNPLSNNYTVDRLMDSLDTFGLKDSVFNLNENKSNGNANIEDLFKSIPEVMSLPNLLSQCFNNKNGNITAIGNKPFSLPKDSIKEMLEHTNAASTLSPAANVFGSMLSTLISDSPIKNVTKLVLDNEREIPVVRENKWEQTQPSNPNPNNSPK